MTYNTLAARAKLIAQPKINVMKSMQGKTKHRPVQLKKKIIE